MWDEITYPFPNCNASAVEIWERISNSSHTSLGMWLLIHSGIKVKRGPSPSLNSLWPSDAIWRQRSGSTLARVMACCLKAPSHSWTNVDWSSVKSNDIHIRAVSQEMPQLSITKICLKITCLKFHSNFPRANALNQSGLIISPNPMNRELWIKMLLIFSFRKSIGKYVLQSTPVYSSVNVLWSCDRCLGG